jgi:hypothetical protein
LHGYYIADYLKATGRRAAMLILYECLNSKIKTLLKIHLFTLPQLVEEFQHVLKLFSVYGYYHK